MSNPLEHPFVAFAAEHALVGSLQEVFVNWISGWLTHGQDVLPRDNDECAAVIKAAVAAYTGTRAAGTSGGDV